MENADAEDNRIGLHIERSVDAAVSPDHDRDEAIESPAQWFGCGSEHESME